MLAGKQSVDLKAPAVRGSRIRRDPPPKEPVKEMSIAQRDEVNQRVVVIGVVAFALAIAIITVGISALIVGWSPSEYTIHIKD